MEHLEDFVHISGPASSSSPRDMDSSSMVVEASTPIGSPRIVSQPLSLSGSGQGSQLQTSSHPEVNIPPLWKKKTSQLHEENRSLQQENIELIQEKRYLTEQLQNVHSQLQQANQKIFSLEIELDEESNKVTENQNLKEYATNLTDDLLLWREHYKINVDKVVKSKQASVVLEHSEQQISQLEIEKKQQQEDLQFEKQKCNMLELKLQTLQQELEQARECQEKQKRLIVQQQQMNLIKMKAREEKYETLRGINLALSQKVLALQSTVERLEMDRLAQKGQASPQPNKN